MKIRGTVGAALIALMLSINACSFDTLIGLKPHPEPLPEKATVDPLPLIQAKIEPVAGIPEADIRQTLQPPASVTSSIISEPQTPDPAPADLRKGLPAESARNERTLNSTPPDTVYRNTVLTEDTVLRGVVEVNGWVTAPPQVTLTVEPGTIIRFRSEEGGITGSGLLVQGRLVASGTPERQILFTGSYEKTAEGDWQGIVLLATDKKNVLEQCRIEGAAVALDAFHSQITVRDMASSVCGTAIRLRESYANVAGGSVRSCGTGVKSIESELEIRDMNLSSNRQGVAVSGGSLYLSGSTFYSNSQVALAVQNSRLRVTGCSFTVNGTGISLKGTEGGISYSKFLNNRDAGMTITDSRTKVNGNNISQNGVTGLRITGSGSVIWGNVIASNNGHDLDYSGEEDLPVMGNWWGETDQSSIPSRIRSGISGGRVLFRPVLSMRPQSVM